MAAAKSPRTVHIPIGCTQPNLSSGFTGKLVATDVIGVACVGEVVVVCRQIS
ncbi:MAG: hypothetical protein U1E35_03855 [Rhodospirillales bacterium]